MKALTLIFLVLLLADGASAQDAINTPSVLDTPGVEVIKNSWRLAVRNPGLEQDPLLINEQQANLEKAQKEAIAENAALARANSPQPPVRVPTQGSAPRVMPTGLWAEYIYEIKLRNTGTKTIRRLVWEYVLSDAGTRPKLRPRQFESNAKIRPGKTKNLVVRSASAPLGVINATQVGKKSQDESLEQLVIQRIEYDDGSVWVRGFN